MRWLDSITNLMAISLSKLGEWVMNRDSWKIQWMEEPGGLQSMGSIRVRHDWVTSLLLFTFMCWRRKMATHSSVLAWRIPGTGEPGEMPSMGSHRIRHDWSDAAAAAAGLNGRKIDGMLAKAESNKCSELVIFYKMLLRMKNKDMIRSSQVL